MVQSHNNTPGNLLTWDGNEKNKSYRDSRLSRDCSHLSMFPGTLAHSSKESSRMEGMRVETAEAPPDVCATSPPSSTFFFLLGIILTTKKSEV
jgi:hypothetical protein